MSATPMITDRHAARHAAPRVRRGSGLGLPLAAFAASRLLSLSATGLAMLLKPGLAALDTFRTWDSVWYLNAASTGYPHQVPHGLDAQAQSTLGFFPLLPLLVRGLGRLTGLPIWISGLVVTTACGAAAVVAVWLFARHLAGPAVADRAATLFAFFPGAMVFGFVYAEPMLIALAAGCLLALFRRQWWLAGLLAAFASAARPTGVVLAVCCAVEAGRAIAARREWRALVAPALAPLGVIGFFAFLHHHTGDARAYMDSQQRGWGQRLDFGDPFHQIASVLAHPWQDKNMLVAVAGMTFIAACGVLLVRLRPPVVVLVYTATVVAVAVFSVTTGAHPRFVLVAFPLFVALGRRLGDTTFAAAVAASAVLLVVLTVVTVTTVYVTP
ncbi:MAG: hypothetical protein ACRDZW_01200 [Acidimicrobiales bacterium]